MAEILVENQICKNCGADVRPQSLFCYNCGGAVSDKALKVETKNGNGKISDVRERETIVENASAKTQIIKSENENSMPVVSEQNKTNDKTPNIHEEAKLKSAAAMRRKAKTIQKKEIEVVWEEPESISSVWLILITLAITIFAAAVIIVAKYLK